MSEIQLYNQPVLLLLAYLLVIPVQNSPVVISIFADRFSGSEQGSSFS